MSQNKPKTFGIAEGQAYREELSKIKTLEEIQAVTNDLSKKSKEFTMSVKDIGLTNVKTVAKFFENLNGVPFHLTAPYIATYDKLQKVTESDVLNVNEIKVIQTMLVGSSWDAKPKTKDPLSEGRKLLKAIQAIQELNLVLGELESKIQAAAAREFEISQELKTGLQTKDAATDDFGNMVKEAKAELVKDKK